MPDKTQRKRKQRPRGNLCVHHKHRIDWHKQANQQAINKRLVVGNNQGARVAKTGGIALHLHPEKRF